MNFDPALHFYIIDIERIIIKTKKKIKLEGKIYQKMRESMDGIVICKYVMGRDNNFLGKAVGIYILRQN